MNTAPDPIYLDYHATTPVDPQVLEAMLPWFTRQFGNPASSSHAFGWKAKEAVEIAREQVGGLLHADPKDIVFTSGATEGINLAIKGIAESASTIGKHIVACVSEHQAVLDSLRWLERKGFTVTFLPVDAKGRIDPDLLRSSLQNDTIMAIVMWANNETGVIQDMHLIGKICAHAGVPLICDATQAVGKIPVYPLEESIAVLVLSAHKMYGPKGTGAVFFNQKLLRTKPDPLIHGGGHERGYRSGTLNVPGIVGLGVASQLRLLRMESDMPEVRKMRDAFEQQMLNQLEEVKVNGDPVHRLPTVTNLMIKYVDSQAVMSGFRTKLAISSGSACSSANPEPSHVLLAMGLKPEEAKASFRVSFGTPSTTAQAEIAASLLRDAVTTERQRSPVWQMFKQGIDLSS